MTLKWYFLMTAQKKTSFNRIHLKLVCPSKWILCLKEFFLILQEIALNSAGLPQQLLLWCLHGKNPVHLPCFLYFLEVSHIKQGDVHFEIVITLPDELKIRPICADSLFVVDFALVLLRRSAFYGFSSMACCK